MVVFLSSNTAGERLRYQRIQTLRRPCYRLLRHRSMEHKAVDIEEQPSQHSLLLARSHHKPLVRQAGAPQALGEV